MARQLLLDYHVASDDLANLPSDPASLLTRLQRVDTSAALIHTRLSNDPVDARRLGANLIDGGDARILVPLFGGALHRSGITKPLRLFDADLLLKHQIVGTYLDDGTFVFETVRGDTSDSRSVSVATTPEGTVVSIYGFVAGETLNSLRFVLRRLTSDTTGSSSSSNVRKQTPFVLDLRYCAGGDVYEAADVATVWLDDRVDWITIHRKNRASIHLQAGVEGTLIHRAPDTLLMSRYTASACEQLIQGLTDYLDIKLVGERTAGKCSVQTTFRLNRKYGLRFTTGNWEGPKDQPCLKSGITPDIAIPGNVHSHEVVESALAH